MAKTSTKRGSNILCRVANPSPSKVCEYVKLLPKTVLSEEEFRQIMGKDWFSNIHQAPEQWGLYYIDGKNYYPRFNHDITNDEAEKYLNGWVKRMIVINPYTRFKSSNDNNLVISIVDIMEKHPELHDLKEIMTYIIPNDEPFIINEILANALNTYSEVFKIKTISNNDESFSIELNDNYKEIIKSKYMNKKEYFDLFADILDDNDTIDSLQQIYYGAPGTGKSHAIDGIVTEDNSIRTTFHPDSDYASFVGCYKPVAKIVDGEKKEITYDFVPQAFTRAYIEAWKDTSKPYYLVIEEINRGNCAQIFGDIFQLLDRGEDGFSSYKITPDTDLQQYLAEEFAEVDIADADIKAGRKMQLPNNLHILATMNTSDQSLFPIDSAFKRRWEWKYIPIKNEDKNHKIVVDGAKYDWFAFMKLVNDRIENVTDSEDKQIGYWFAKANEKDEISAETLVSKVIFYLWNDVFKDYAHSDNSLFNIKNRKYKFREFYHENGDVNTILLKQFLKELGLKDDTSQTNEVPSAEENQEPEQPTEE